MSARFTAEEDMMMWRFAMEQHPGYGKANMWELFKKRTGSKRTTICLYKRFYRILLPNLWKTKFHVETKLKLCQKYNVEVDEEFLKELKNDAEVNLNRDGTVNSYQLKPNCPKNRDLEMDDKEFTGIMPLITNRKRYTSEEEAEIWSYVLENLQEYGRGGERFWKGLVVKMNWNRTLSSLINRFLNNMAPNLQRMDFSIEQKLKLYKRCQIPVDKKYLKTLKQHAKLKIDEDRCITKYKMKTGRPEKRKNAEETKEEAKKAKRVIPEEPSDDQDEDEDMVFDDIVPGTDTRRAKKAREESPEPVSEAQEEEDDSILDKVVDRSFLELTAPVSRRERKQFTAEEDRVILSYVLENLESYTRGKSTFWTEMSNKLENRSQRVLIMRFQRTLARNLHKLDLSIEDQLKIYKACQISASAEHLPTLHEYAELQTVWGGYIKDYKMRPEKRKKKNGEDENAKKARRDVPGTAEDQEEDEDLVFDDVVPGSSSEVQQEDEDLILDNVVDRGWRNPDMIIRKPPKIEVDDDEDDPAVEELDDMFIPKEELFDEIDVEYAEMVNDDGGQGFGENSENFEDIPLNDDYSRVVGQRRDEQSDSMTKMLEIMQRMEQKMENQEAAHMKVLSEMKKDLEASHKEDMSEVKKALETSQHQVGELSKTVASMQSQAEDQSSAMSSLQSEMQMIRNEMKTGSPDDTTTSAMKKFLLNFKNFVSSLESPELAPVEQRIDTALQNLHDSDQRPPPTTNLRSIFEVALTAIGH